MRYFSRSFISLLVIAGLLSGVVLVAPPAAAVSTVWTSTSDFDAGTKQDGTEFFTNVGVAQPMYSLISAPSTWYANGKTYVVFLGTASVPSSTYLVYITSYDHASGAWATPISIATGSIVADDHSAPSLFIDPSGFLHVFYGAHDSSIEYIKSTNPYDTSSWTTMADPESGTATYPSPFSYSSNIWLRYREGGGSTFDDWGYRTSADGGSTWSGLTVFLRVGGTDGTYLSAPEIWTDRFYFVFSRLVSGVRHNLYLCYLDLDTGDNFDMAGTNLGPLVDSAEAEANCLISNMGNCRSGRPRNGSSVHRVHRGFLVNMAAELYSLEWGGVDRTHHHLHDGCGPELCGHDRDLWDRYRGLFREHRLSWDHGRRNLGRWRHGAMAFRWLVVLPRNTYVGGSVKKALEFASGSH